MRLNNQIIDEIVRVMKIGMYAKDAIESVGIGKRTFYRWKEDGIRIDVKCYNEDGERIEKEWKKLNKTEKLKLHFWHSVRQSEAEGKKILIASIFSHIRTDWRAAMEMLARRFPEDWAKRDYMKVDSNVTHKQSKLKEFEDQNLADIPTSVISDLTKDYIKKLDNARDHKEKKGPEPKDS